MSMPSRVSGLYVLLASWQGLEFFEAASETQPVAPRGVVSAMALFLLVGALLVLVLLAALFVLMRTLRRYRAAVSRERESTTYVDAWAMHKVPDMDVLEDDDDDLRRGPRNDS